MVNTTVSPQILNVRFKEGATVSKLVFIAVNASIWEKNQNVYFV